MVPARGTPTLWTRLGSEARGGRTCIQSPALGPQGIEPRSVVPETTVLSVELQAHFSARCIVSSMETYCARMVVAAATGGESVTRIPTESRSDYRSFLSATSAALTSLSGRMRGTLIRYQNPWVAGH